jgi:hypothetical protein
VVGGRHASRGSPNAGDLGRADVHERLPDGPGYLPSVHVVGLRVVFVLACGAIKGQQAFPTDGHEIFPVVAMRSPHGGPVSPREGRVGEM